MPQPNTPAYNTLNPLLVAHMIWILFWYLAFRLTLLRLRECLLFVALVSLQLDPVRCTFTSVPSGVRRNVEVEFETLVIIRTIGATDY